MPEPQVETVAIPARDGYVLAGTCFQPTANPTRTVVTINAAGGPSDLLARLIRDFGPAVAVVPD